MKPGIERINITNKTKGQGAWRFTESQKRWPLTEAIYHQAFAAINPLLPGTSNLDTTQEQFEAGYDKYFGVDVILNHQSGMTSTLQEKILFTTYQTVTVEYMNDPISGEQGDWFSLRVDYYFVGYDRTKTAESIQDWILLDWRKVKELTGAGKIDWKEQYNGKDGARASFKWVHFKDIPEICIVASSFNQPKIQRVIKLNERESIILNLSQCHLNPGWSVARQTELFNGYGIFTTESWNNLTTKQLRAMTAELNA